MPTDDPVASPVDISVDSQNTAALPNEVPVEFSIESLSRPAIPGQNDNEDSIVIKIPDTNEEIHRKFYLSIKNPIPDDFDFPEDITAVPEVHFPKQTIEITKIVYDFPIYIIQRKSFPIVGLLIEIHLFI